MTDQGAPTSTSARFGKAIPQTKPTAAAQRFVSTLEHLLNTSGNVGNVVTAIESYLELYAPQFIRIGETCPFNSVPFLDAPPHDHFRRCIRSFLAKVDGNRHVIRMHSVDDTATILWDAIVKTDTGAKQVVRTLTFIKFNDDQQIELEISKAMDEEGGVGMAWEIGNKRMQTESSTLFLNRMSASAHIMRLPFNDNICAVVFGEEPPSPQLRRKCTQTLMQMFNNEDVVTPETTRGQRVVAGALTYTSDGALFTASVDTGSRDKLPPNMADLVMSVPASGSWVHVKLM